MDAGEPLARYFDRRLKVLFRRRYSPAWRLFNVYLNGLGISKKPRVIKTPIHFQTSIIVPDGHREPYWGITYEFRYYGYPKVETRGYVKVIGHLIQVFSSCWNDNLLATAGGNSWSFELADPDCIEKVVTKFKRMFPYPQVRV